MSTQPFGDLKHPDEIDELFGHANPNPDRVGCPPRNVAIALARRQLPLSDPSYKHLTACSPCYVEVRAIQESDREQRRRRVIRMIARGTAAAAVLLAVAVAGWFFLAETRPTEVSAELDLRPYALTRGEPTGTDRQPLMIPRARVALTLLLPAGSEPGVYEIQILDTEFRPRASANGNAVIENYVTTFRSDLDLHALPAGQYHLAIHREGDKKQLFEARLQ